MQDVPIPAMLPDSRGQPGATDSGEVMIATSPFDFDYAGLVAWQVIAAAAPAPQMEPAFDTRDPVIRRDSHVGERGEGRGPAVDPVLGIVALKAGTFAEPGAVRVGIRVLGPARPDPRLQTFPAAW